MRCGLCWIVVVCVVFVVYVVFVFFDSSLSVLWFVLSFLVFLFTFLITSLLFSCSRNNFGLFKIDFNSWKTERKVKETIKERNRNNSFSQLFNRSINSTFVIQISYWLNKLRLFVFVSFSCMNFQFVFLFFLLLFS